MTTTPPGSSGFRPRMRLVPTEHGGVRNRITRRPPDPQDDAKRIEEARRLARTTAIGRELLDRLDADGVRVELVPDEDFAVRHGAARSARRVTMTTHQSEDGVLHLARRTVIAVPWTTMLRPKEGALALVHQGAHHMLDLLASPEAPMSPARREEQATAMRTLVERELRGTSATPPDVSVEAIVRTYRGGARPPGERGL